LRNYGIHIANCRMESTGAVHHVQLSEDTVELLRAAGKDRWFTKREETVEVKGKGTMQTYWLKVPHEPRHIDHTPSQNVICTSEGSQELSCEESEQENTGGDDDFAQLNTRLSRKRMKEKSGSEHDSKGSEKMSRLIKWNVDVLARLLTQVVAHRDASGAEVLSQEEIVELESSICKHSIGKRTIDEVQEIIPLPGRDISVDKATLGGITLDPIVLDQLHTYVTNIAKLYNDNPFHNFEHASHGK